jgi:hypothetical protein
LKHYRVGKRRPYFIDLNLNKSKFTESLSEPPDRYSTAELR